VPAGAWLVASFAAIALIAAFFLRTRVPSPVVTLALAASGAGLGWGAMLLQTEPSSAEFVAAVLILALLVPVHVRVVFGPFGRR
jgi:hypothetical protein